MKKIFLTILASIFAISTYAENRITVADVNLANNGSGILAVSVSLEATRMSFMTTVTLPAGLTITGVSAGPIYDGPMFAFNNTEGTTWKISAMCVNEYTSTEGALVYITIKDNGDTNDVGDVLTINFSGFELGNGNAPEAFFPANTSCQVTITDGVVLDEMSTTPFANVTTTVPVTVTRSLKKDIWNTIVLPFEVYDGPTTFGDGVQVAQLSSASIYDASGTLLTGKKSGENLGTVEFDFTSVDLDNDVLSPGMPYIIKPITDINEFTEEGETGAGAPSLTWTDEPSSTVPVNGNNTVSNYCKFIGSYTANTVIPANSFFLSGNKFYTSVGSAALKGFRGYFSVFWKGASVTLAEESAGVKMSFFVDGVETAIDGITSEVKSGKVYSIDGKYIGEDVNLNRMQKGIYIVNGKKVINK